MRKIAISICQILCALFLLSSQAQSQAIHISESSLEPDRQENLLGAFFLSTGWKYHPGDRAEWATPTFDDSAWDTLTTRANPWDVPNIDDWQGIGWLRLHLNVAPDLRDRPLALYCLQMGASEIYLDGGRIGAFGTVGKDKSTEESVFLPHNKAQIMPVEFEGAATHVIAVRFSNFWALEYQHLGIPAWFGLGLAKLSDSIAQRIALTRDITIYQMLCIAPLAFALLHFLLFLFYPEYKRNLYYAIFALSVSAMIYTPFQSGFVSDSFGFLYLWIFKISLILSMLSGQRFLYHIFFDTMPRFYRVPLAIGILMLLLSWYIPVDYVYIFVVVLFLELLRTVFVAVYRKIDGARIVGIGFVIFAMACTYQVLLELAILEQDFTFPYIYGILALMISMSVYLACSFAQTYGDLKNQLDQVKALSDQAIEHERLAREQELARKSLEAENALKNQELEEARKRQRILDELEETHRNLQQTQA